MVKIVSACLLGVNCRYDGKSKPNEKVIKLSEKEILIPVCPEQLGGLPTPRASAGIYSGLGEDVLDSKASVRTIEYGKDITEYFIKGAKEVLRLVKLYNIKEAVLKQKSPSCGCGLTWRLNDDFKNSVTEGNGVTAALLKRNGINVLSGEEL